MRYAKPIVPKLRWAQRSALRFPVCLVRETQSKIVKRLEGKIGEIKGEKQRGLVPPLPTPDFRSESSSPLPVSKKANSKEPARQSGNPRFFPLPRLRFPTIQSHPRLCSFFGTFISSRSRYAVSNPTPYRPVRVALGCCLNFRWLLFHYLVKYWVLRIILLGYCS